MHTAENDLKAIYIYHVCAIYHRVGGDGSGVGERGGGGGGDDRRRFMQSDDTQEQQMLRDESSEYLHTHSSVT